MLLQTKITSWTQRDTTPAKKSHSRTRRKPLSFSDPETLWKKIKDLKALLSHKKDRYASKEVKENAFATTLTSGTQRDTTLQENITFRD